MSAGPLVLGLGANLGDEPTRIARFAAVAGWWARHGAVARSSVYRSAALSAGQPDYLNAAIAIELTRTWSPARVLTAIRGLEARHGRDRAREGHWGARTLDLDVLAWGPRALTEPRLIVPHPRLGDRSFVLAPLVDLLGADAILPGHARSLGALLAAAGPPLTRTDYGFASAA